MSLCLFSAPWECQRKIVTMLNQDSRLIGEQSCLMILSLLWNLISWKPLKHAFKFIFRTSATCKHRYGVTHNKQERKTNRYSSSWNKTPSCSSKHKQICREMTRENGWPFFDSIWCINGGSYGSLGTGASNSTTRTNPHFKYRSVVFKPKVRVSYGDSSLLLALIESLDWVKNVEWNC